MNIKYTIKGLDKTLNQIKLYSKNKQEAVNKDIHAAGLEVESEAKLKAPKEFGVLGASIKANNLVKFVSRIGTNVVYAPHQEFGTRYMKAQPFLRPAFYKAVKKLEKTIKKTMSKL